MKSYSQYLSSKRWKEKRKQVIERQKKCQRCDATKNLHVHHVTYKNIGNELDEDLLLLCRSCHAKEHNVNDRSEESFVKFNLSSFNFMDLNLSNSECKFLFLLGAFVGYDGKLSHKNGKPLTRTYLKTKLNIDISTVDKLIHSLTLKDIVIKTKEGRNVVFSMNSKIFNKGKKIS